jgi:hypothetical protein
LFEIDDQRAIDLPFPKGKIVDTDNAWRRKVRIGSGLNDPQQRIWAEGNP